MVVDSSIESKVLSVELEDIIVGIAVDNFVDTLPYTSTSLHHPPLLKHQLAVSQVHQNTLTIKTVVILLLTYSSFPSTFNTTTGAMTL